MVLDPAIPSRSTPERPAGDAHTHSQRTMPMPDATGQGPLFDAARAHQLRREFEAARSLYERIGEQTPFDFMVSLHELNCAQEVCDWRRYDHLQRVVCAATHYGNGWALGETTIALPRITAADQRQSAQRHARFVLARMGVSAAQPGYPDVPSCPPLPAGLPHRRPKNGRARIAFLGEDFHAQATAYLSAGVIAAHDRERFEYVAWDMHPAPPDDMVRARLARAYDRIETVGNLDSQAIAARIGADSPDILVYMQGPTHPGVEVLALRPAPVQIAWLYYPGPVAAPLVDAMIADGTVIPPALEHHYPCTVLRLPGCYQPNDAQRALPGTVSRAQYGLPEDAFVIANFGQSYKITPDIFDIWCALLRRYPQCVLWLLGMHEQAITNLRHEARIRGVDPARLHFVPVAPATVHLARLALADVVADTYPYGGHTLTSDALWAGTPVVTMAGETFASRVAASLLHHTGLDDYVSSDPRGYEACLAGLIEAPARARQTGAWLAASRRRQALFDSVGYARRLEALWTQLIHDRSGAQPDANGGLPA